ncbi:MAG: DUF3373 family protein [Helicobacteraceae bacterium]|nr:DUF3373 family protein [Helicobacteraceae bacterium]
MKKLLILTTFTTLLLASQSELEKRIEFLENEILELKQLTLQNTKSTTLNTKLTSQNSKISKLNADDVSDILPILDYIERKSILDKINFSPELELRVDKFDYQNNGIEGENTKIYDNPAYRPDGTYDRRDNYTKNFAPATTIRFRLNMSAELDEKVKFNGRMLFVNSSQSNERVCILSRDIKSVTSSSAFDIDRAYIDYTPNKKSDKAFTLSFGVLPTTSGTPMQFAQSTKRKSMFPALVFDMNTYGVIGTQKVASDSYLRAILAKAYTLRASFYPYQCNRENIDNANVAGLYYDTKLNFLGNSLLSFGVNLLNDFKAHPYLGPDVNADDAHNLGDIFTYGIGLDIQKFAKTDATVFLHTALSNPHGNGNSDNYQIDPSNPSAQLTVDGGVGFSTASYAQGTMLKDNGYSVYLGSKYDLNKEVSFGAEYNHGSKYWFSATQGATDMYNKLATRGDAVEGYLTWQFYSHLYAKVGYLYIKEDYTGSGWHFGEPAKKDATQSIGYMSLTAKY